MEHDPDLLLRMQAIRSLLVPKLEICKTPRAYLDLVEIWRIYHNSVCNEGSSFNNL